MTSRTPGGNDRPDMQNAGGWRGLHNSEGHTQQADYLKGERRILPGRANCNLCLSICGDVYPCRCCLAAEVERLKAQVQKVREFADRLIAEDANDLTYSGETYIKAWIGQDILSALDGGSE